jgi:RNA polymerase sigma-54 factor
MFQFQYQTQKPLTTAHLAQTMTLLGMTSAELSQKVEAELANNPALELIEERRCPTCHKILLHPGPCLVCSSPKSSDVEEPIVFISSQDDHYSSHSIRNDHYSGEELPDDNIAPEENLPTYVLRQIASELNPEDHLIVAHILTSLDDDGLLTTTPFDISRYHHVPVSEVNSLIQLIQKSDPIGVGSTSPEEALLVQLNILRENGNAVPPQAERAIREGLSLLSRHQYSELAKDLEISKSGVEEIALFISNNLNPFPGRAHWGDSRQKSNDTPSVYHKPDIIVNQMPSENDGQLMVEILLPIRGTLQVNPLFRQTLKAAPEETAENWKKDLESASLFIKCIQQRNNTMQKLMAYIVKFQRSFILKGEKHLLPITRAEVSIKLGVHESTISRAVAGKCLQLPTGQIIPLSRFFDRSLHIRAQLKDIIESESSSYTDTQLASILTQKGINIARRTVAKYRAMEGILPAHMRKNLKNSKKPKWSTYSLSSQEFLTH